MDAYRSVTPNERSRALNMIAAEVAVCTRCPLHETRTQAVPGEGHPETEVVFVGEGPGYNEDQQGRPFVGAAGTLLNDLLKQIGWKRQDVFITNVVKCRPPGNRDPEPNEIAACAPFLKRQLAVLDPAVIVTLGRHSLGHFNPGARISAEHGTARPADPETGAPDATTYAMYHPAAALRQGSLKATMLHDMCGLPDVLIEARARRAPAAEVDVPVAVVVAAETDAAPIAVVAAEAVAEEMHEPAVDQVEPEPQRAVVIEIQPPPVRAIAIDIETGNEVVYIDENQMPLF
jgi:DNA polymerase